MSKSEMFHEVRHGKGYAKTRKKHGKETARKQMIARVLEAERGKKSAKNKRSKHRSSGR
jgi:hypothetical protein